MPIGITLTFLFDIFLNKSLVSKYFLLVTTIFLTLLFRKKIFIGL